MSKKKTKKDEESFMKFTTQKGDVIGRIDVKKGKLFFEGDVDESAKTFISTMLCELKKALDKHTDKALKKHVNKNKKNIAEIKELQERVIRDAVKMRSLQGLKQKQDIELLESRRKVIDKGCLSEENTRLNNDVLVLEEKVRTLESVIIHQAKKDLNTHVLLEKEEKKRWPAPDTEANSKQMFLI